MLQIISTDSNQLISHNEDELLIQHAATTATLYSYKGSSLNCVIRQDNNNSIFVGCYDLNNVPKATAVITNNSMIIVSKICCRGSGSISWKESIDSSLPIGQETINASLIYTYYRKNEIPQTLITGKNLTIDNLGYSAIQSRLSATSSKGIEEATQFINGQSFTALGYNDSTTPTIITTTGWNNISNINPVKSSLTGSNGEIAYDSTSKTFTLYNNSTNNIYYTIVMRVSWDK